MGLGTPLSVLLLLAGVWAAPTPEGNLCSTQCDNTTPLVLGYQPGKVYTYQYESTNVVGLSGTTNDEGKIKISATIESHILGPCDIALRIKDVKLAGDSHPGDGDAAAFKTALEDKPVVVAMHNGQIEGLCYHPKDPVWAVNIKRGILSAFSGNPAVFVEKQVRDVATDIHGHCETQHEVTSDGGNMVYKRTKNLSTCTENHGHITAIQADSFSSNSPFQSVPAFKSSQECQYTISGGLVQNAACTERHLLLPFSKNNNGAVTTSTVTGKFVGVKDGVIKNLPRNLVHGSIVFDYTVEHATSAGAEQEVLAAVRQLCDLTKDDIKAEAANAFTNLHDLIGRLPPAALQSVYGTLQAQCPSKITQDIFLDAVATAGSEGAVKLMVQLLSSGQVSKLRARVWYARLAFVQNPTLEILGATLPLLDQPAPHKTAFLGISALAHAYCRHHEDCEKAKQIEQLVEKLTRHLGNKCKSNSPDELNRVIVALKAFGNLGIAGKALPVLTECITTDALPVEVRVAALEAFRRMPCVNQAAQFEILDDTKEDSELRITAYLNLIRCPNYKTFHKLKELLEHEEVNQVSSFIYTHLTNLQETSSRDKQSASKVVSHASLKKKFLHDARKWSANYEISNYLRQLNIGGSLESNVIFSPKSFLPRSVSFNVTADLFGHTFNFLELGVRVSGVERRLEALFGPVGKTKTTPLRDVLRNRFNDILKGRTRREIPYKPQKVKNLLDKSVIEADQEVEASVSLKIFGNELSWLNARDLRKLAAGTGGGKYDGLRNFIEKLAQEKSVEFGRSFAVLDSTMVIPSATGIPIKLSINGTAVVGIKANGHIDLREYFAERRQVDIAGLIQPSASIEISRSLVIDAHVTKCGVKLRRTTHFSHALSGVYQRKQGEKLKVSLSMPRDQVELLSGKNELLVIHNNMEHPVTLNFPDKYEINACTVYLQEILGVEACIVADLPRPLLNPDRPYLPLGAPHSFVITLKKVDPNQKSVELLLERTIDRDANGQLLKRKFQLLFDTPGSQKTRTVSIGYDLDLQAKTLSANLKTPFRQLELQGGYTKSDSGVQGKWTLTADNTRQYTIDAGFGRAAAGPVITLTPKIEVTTPSDKYTIIQGSIVNNQGAVDIDLESGNKLFGEKFSLKGKVNLGATTTYDLAIGTPSIEAKLVGQTVNDGGSPIRTFKVENNVQYSFRNAPGQQHTIHGVHTWVNNFSTQQLKYDAQVELSNRPEWNRKVHLEYNYGTAGPNNQLDIKYGGNFDDPARHIQVEWRYQREGTFETGLTVNRILKIKYPRREIDFDHSSYFHYEKKRALEHKFVVNGGLFFQSFTSDFSYKDTSAALLNRVVQWKVTIPNRELAYKSVLVEKAKGDYAGEIDLQWNTGKHLKIVGEVKDKGTDDLTHFESKHVITVTGRADPIQINTVLKCGEDTHVYNVQVQSGAKKHHLIVSHIHTDEEHGTLDVDVNLPSVVGKINGKRNGNTRNIDIDVKFFNDRRIKGKSTAQIDGSVRSVNVDLQLDADADPNRKLVFVGKVKRPPGVQRITEIDGSLQLPSKKVQLHVYYNIPRVFFEGGHHVFKSEITYDDQKKAILDIDIDVDRSEGRRVSEGRIVVLTPYTVERTVVYKTRLEKTEDVKAVGFRVRVSSPGLEDITAELSAQKGYRNIGSSIGFGFGDRVLKVGLGAKFNVDADSRDIGYNIDIRTPIENAKAFVLSLDHYAQRNEEVGIIRHESRVILFDPAREASLKVDWNRKGNRENGFSVRSHVNIVSPFARYTSGKIDSRLNLEYEPAPNKRIVGDFDLKLSEEKRVQANLAYTRNEKGINGHLVIDAPHRDYKHLDVVLKHKRNAPNYDTTFTAKWEPNKKITYVSKKFIDQNRVKVDTTITTPLDGFQEIKIKGDHEYKGDKGNGNAVVQWADKKVTITKKSTGVQAGSFDTEINIASTPNLPFDGWKLKAKRTVAGANRQLNGVLFLGEGRELGIDADLKGKPNNGGVTGTVAFTLNGDPVMQSNVDSTVVGSDWKTDRQANYKVEIINPYTEGPVTIDFSLVRTVSDFIHKNKICAGDTCIYGELDIEGIGTSNYKEGIVNRTLAWKGGFSNGNNKNTMGYYYKAFRVPGTLELISRVTYHEEKNQFVGFRVIGNRKTDGQKSSLDGTATLELPNREAKLNVHRVKDNRGYKANIDLALDAKKDPTHKLATVINIVNKPNDLYDVNVQITHPLLPKPAVITSQATYRQGHTILKAVTVLDIARDPTKKITWETELHNYALGDPTSFNYSYVFKVQQDKPTPVNFKVAGQFGHHIGHLLRKIDLSWQNQQGENKEIHLLGDIDRNHKEVKFVSRSPLRVTEVDLRWYWVAQPDLRFPLLRANLETSVDHKVTRRGYLDISAQPHVLLKYLINPTDEPDRVFVYSADRVDDKNYKITATRNKGGQSTQDLEFLISLSQPQLIHVTGKWTPGLLKQAIGGAVERVRELVGKAKEVSGAVLPEFIAEVREYRANVRSIVESDWKPLLQHASEEVQEIRQEIQAQRSTQVVKELFAIFAATPIGQEIAAKYGGGGGGGQIGVLLGSVRVQFGEYLQSLLERTQLAIKSLVEGLPNLREHLAPWRAAAQAWAESIQKNKGGFRQYLSEVFQYTGSTKTLDALRSRVREIVGKLRDGARAVVEEVKAIIHDFIANIRIRDVVSKYADWAAEVAENVRQAAERLQEKSIVVKKICEAIKEVAEKFRQRIEALRARVQERRQQIREKITTILEEAKKNPEFARIAERVKNVVEKIVEIVRDSKTRSLGDYLNTLSDNLQTYGKNFAEAAAQASFRVDREKGELEANIPLLLPANSLREVRDRLYLLRLLSPRDAEIKDKLTRLYYHVLLPLLRTRVRPPYEAQGVVVGNNHFISFDGRHLEFAGDCEYLLTQDAIDGNFSVVVNYDNGQIKSFVLAAEEHNVEVRTDSTVLVDDRKVEVPTVVGHIEIKKDGHNIVVKSDKGIELSVDPEHSIHVVNINGYYFAKTQGLLGTYNYERFDDRRGPNGHDTKDAGEFVNSWEVSKSCPSKVNREDDREARPNSPAERLCRSYFKGKFSRLRYAFPLVDAEPYYHACLHELALTPQQSEATQGVCRIAAAYKQVARIQGASLVALPIPCIKHL